MKKLLGCFVVFIFLASPVLAADPAAVEETTPPPPAGALGVERIPPIVTTNQATTPTSATPTSGTAANPQLNSTSSTPQSSD